MALLTAILRHRSSQTGKPEETRGTALELVAPVATYRLKYSLLTAAEMRFLNVLEQAVGPEYRILSKVRVADILDVVAGDNSSRQSGFNRISGKHFDFVVCSARDWAILYAVELDDSSHGRRVRQERDAFLNDACNCAGLPLHRFPVQRQYSVDALRAKLQQRRLAA